MATPNDLNTSLKKEPAIIKLFPSIEEKTFTEMEALNAFVVAENDFWSPMNAGITREIGAHFNSASACLKQAIAATNANQADSLLAPPGY
jgi:hypothetical protein